MKDSSKASGHKSPKVDFDNFPTVDLCGTPDLEHYRATGELPEDEGMREMFKLLFEHGLIDKYDQGADKSI